MNILIVSLVFSRAQRISKAMGKAGSMAVAKVFALFLAGIAIMMIRSGIQTLLQHQ